MKKLVLFYRLAREELDKVIYPTKAQIINASISVFVVVFIISLFLYIVDIILNSIINIWL